jgi:hypothetical protein
MTGNQLSVARESASLWRVTFNNPPINMFVPTTIDELGALMTDLEADPSVKVVVFQTANPIFSSPISTWPRQRNGQRCWAFGATLCCAFRPRPS